jgi:hypothetical protein
MRESLMKANALTTINASRATASIWGILAGLGGLTHGIGEVRQGNVAPDGLIIASWTTGPIATNMGGEPAMTIIPNLLVTGLLTIIVSLAVIVWAVAFVQRQHGGRGLIFLSLGLLLVGGGFGPPIMGLIAGWAGSGINSPLTWWRTHLSTTIRHSLAKLWPWVFSVCLMASLLLVIGSVILVYFFNVNNADFFSNLFLCVVGLLLLTVMTGFGYDLHNREPGVTEATS